MSASLFWVLLICCLLNPVMSVALGAPAVNQTLVFAFEIQRHGARAPLELSNHNDTGFNVPPMMLTS